MVVLFEFDGLLRLAVVVGGEGEEGEEGEKEGEGEGKEEPVEMAV